AVFSFFFQAEDGIRYFHVTGVQTCALPISATFPCRNCGPAAGRQPQFLHGKVAVVTGSARGIGWAIARSLAEAGASVVLNDVRDDIDADRRLAELAALGGMGENDADGPGGNAPSRGSAPSGGGPDAPRHRFIAADVSKFEDVARLRDEVIAEYGGIDILVNNAGK